MKLVSLLLRQSRSSLVLAVLCGLLSGGGSAALIWLINGVLSQQAGALAAGAAGFAGIGLVALLSRISAQVLLNNLHQGALMDLRMKLSRRILGAPLRRLEELGRHRLLATLTDDVVTVGYGLTVVPFLFVNLAIVSGCLTYLLWLSWKVFLAMAGFMVVGLLTYWLPTTRALGLIKQARETQDSLYKHFRALTEGTKELKLHGPRGAAFLDESLAPTADALRRLNGTSGIIFSATSSWGLFLFFVFIGLLLYALPAVSPVSPGEMVGYILTLLYLQQPLQVIMDYVPVLSRGNVALQKIESLGLSLEEGREQHQLPSRTAPASFSSLELRGVTHTYYREQEEGRFVLGPIHLTLRPGELIFLVGGNGSGKTTLAKLLTGLYPPESGELLVDGQPITEQERERYRQYFSAIFPDFYLFERLIGLAPPGLEAQAQAYLERLQLERKVRLTGGTLSTTDLSQGQRKRLALLTAYLEDRPIYLFDEWAADQDPLFKDIFYRELLPELRRRGKTVIAITHDDRYFSLADRLLRLENGQLSEPGAETRAAS